MQLERLLERVRFVDPSGLSGELSAHMTTLPFALLLLLGDCDRWTRDKPAALRHMEESRQSIVTGEFRWRETRPDQELPEQRYVTRIAGPDVLFTNLGDERGVRSFEIVADERRPKVSPPGRLLLNGDEVWSYTEGELLATVQPASARSDLLDIRTVGLWPGGKLLKDWTSYLERDGVGGGAPEFCTDSTPHGAIVSMRYPSHPNETTRWTTDARYGYQPTRCELVVDGKVLRRTEVEYSDAGGGEFFVQRAESFDVDGYMYCRIDVDQASVNEPQHPPVLTPADLGIGNGFNVAFREGHPRFSSTRSQMILVDGDFLSFEEYVERQTTVGVEPCPRYAKEFPELVETYHAVLAKRGAAEARLSTSQPTAGGQPGEWERYTLAFIERYKLDADQRQMALNILAECQTRGWAHVTRVKPELDAIDRRAATEQRSTRAPGWSQAQIAAAREKLLRPLDDIFQNELKPRLEKLPTRAQRQAVENPESPARPARP
jgi:hypothetical protein